MILKGQLDYFTGSYNVTGAEGKQLSAGTKKQRYFFKKLFLALGAFIYSRSDRKLAESEGKRL